MEEKKSHTKNERSLPDHEEQELWFSALAADDSWRSIVLFLVPSKNAVRYSIFLKSFMVRQRLSYY